MKKVGHMFFCVLSTLLLVSCGTSPDTPLNNADLSDKYIIQTPLYQIYEESLQKYRYKIGSDQKTFAEGTENGTEPEIEEIDDGIVRLHMGFGTNAFSVQYFDIWNDRTSVVFSPFAIYADYVNPKTKECLIAYFEYDATSEKYILTVKDIFNEKGFSTKIDKDFSSGTCNELVILNESEIYVDYAALSGSNLGKSAEFESVRDVIRFR